MFAWVRCDILIASIFLLGLGSSCDYSESTCGASSPGDIMIGMLCECHGKAETPHNGTQPGRFNCTEFDMRAFIQTLAVIHTIDTINDSGFLPGIRLGYIICDTCADASKALQNAMHLLAINSSMTAQCDFTESPVVKAIIGARFSEVSIAVAPLIGIFMVPQISTTSSAAILDDKFRFPSFLRTIPSDEHQTRALAQLMAHFDWNWVGVVSGDDAYGRDALHGFLKEADTAGVCTAFQEVLPHYLGHSDNMPRIREVADRIQSSNAQVVLLILRTELVEQLFEEMIGRGISRTWIATDSWSMSRTLASMKGINAIGDIFGFSFIKGHNPGFKNFLTNLVPGPGVVNHFIEEYKDARFGCSPELIKHRECLKSNPAAHCPLSDSLMLKSELACTLPDPQKANDDFLTHAVDLRLTYSETLAVWSIAHALRSLLKCSQFNCSRETNILPRKLLQELKKINFTHDNKQFFFDDSGSFVDGYDLVYWTKRGDGHGRHFEDIGRYNLMEGVVEIRSASINWATTNKTVPESRCSESCPPGTAKKIFMIHCCYNCSVCEEGTYTNGSDLLHCLVCPNGTWSLRGWSKCEARTESYLRLKDHIAIVLLVATGLGYLLLVSVLIIFVIGRHTVVFQVAGGKLCFIMMAGLAVSFGAVVLFVGRPNDHICRSRQTMYSFGFTLTVSCILVKAFRTFLAFLMDGHRQHMLNKLYKPPVIIICGTAIQGLICLVWLIISGPKVEVHILRQSMAILRQCNEGSNWGFGIMLCYIALLALICFILALKARKVPQRFNETGHIIFCMLIYLFVWVCFIPIYVTKSQQRSSVQASAIVVSNFGVIFCLFFPKCYMILSRKKDISQQAYLNRVRMYSIDTTKNVLSDFTCDSEEGSTEAVPPCRGNSVKSCDSTDSGISNVKSSIAVIALRDIRQRFRSKSLI